jgi:GntR family transcriptional regulator
VSKAGGKPLEYVVSRYRGDRYQIHMSLGRDDIGPSSATEGNSK